ncbi:MAG: leucine-rich repeat domain-containing protein [Paludibacteraceae bacterium]|nr:leucine-rich repeat domain-containing protein [Paludibacteraceae bacterium]
MKPFYSRNLAAVILAATLGVIASQPVQALQLWPVQMDDVTLINFSNMVVADFRNGQNDNYVAARNKTYIINDSLNSLNFFGQYGYLSYILNSTDETPGVDFYLGDTSSVNAATRLKTAIVNGDDTYYLHFAIKSTDNAAHAIYTFNDVNTTIQFSPYYSGWTTQETGGRAYYVSDFERDDEWHEYFVPMSDFASILSSSQGSSTTGGTQMSSGDMIVSFITPQGEKGNLLNLDAVFFCDEELRKVLQSSDTTGTVQEQEPVTGMCGDSVYWTYYPYPGQGMLMLSGQGTMWDGEITKQYIEYADSIVTLIVDDGIREIGDNAFSSYPALQTVSLAGSVQTIRNDAFSGCTSLQFVGMQEGLTTIAEWAFNGCTSLNSLELPSTLTSIGDEAFKNCSGFHIIMSEAINPPSLGDSVFAGVDKSIPLYVPETSMGVYNTTAGWSDFKNIQAIGDSTNVEFPNGMCGDSVTWMFEEGEGYLIIQGSGAMWNFSDASAGYSDYSRSTAAIIIDEGVTSVGDFAFERFTQAAMISLGPDVQSIGQKAFAACTSITGIYCQPSTPPTWGDANVFSGLDVAQPIIYVYLDSYPLYKQAEGWKDFTNYKGIVGDSIVDLTTPVTEEEYTGMCGDSVTWTLKGRTMTISGSGTMWDYSAEAPAIYSEYMQQIDTVMVESGVTTLGANAFNGFPTLKLVVLPYGMKTIGDNAFTDCTSLTFVQMPQDLTTIGASAFQGCENLFVQRLPETLYSIGENAFEACRSITNLVIPNKVNIIGNEAFLQCTGLQSVVLPEQLGSIAPNMFSFCMSLESVQLPQELGTIGDNAFYACQSLRSITLPETLDDIEGGAFAMCYGLNFIQCEAVLPPTLWDNADNPVFNEVSDSIPVYVPAEAVEAYLHSDWNYFKNIQAIPSDTVVPIEVTIFGITITPDDSTSTEPIDLLGDSTLVYDPEENTLTFNGLEWEVGEEETTVINYTGSDPLTIVLNDTSTIMADTIIASAADIIITGEGKLVAEGTVPIVGVKSASITFDSVTMHVRSVPTPQALRRRIKSGKRLDETGGPALSGFGSADFNKTNVSPSDASYGPVTTTDDNGEETTIDALYTTNEDGEQEVVTEFDLTAQADDTGVDAVRVRHDFDPSQPMYNVLGLPVDATYKGIVVQGGQTYLLR